MPLIFPCQRDFRARLHSPFPIQLAPGHGPVCALSTHLLESSIVFRVEEAHIARAALDDMGYVFTPSLCNEELLSTVKVVPCTFLF